MKISGRTVHVLSCTLLILTSLSLKAQTTCPANLDFEFGNFQNWQCFTGGVSIIAGRNQINLDTSDPDVSRHTIYSQEDAATLDHYGNFPVLCPNGSGHSIKLGNNLPGREAERVSYTFTIPFDQPEFSLLYQYAVVFQDPNHTEKEQPRFMAKVYDVASENYISCASAQFVANANIPGFIKSPASTNVWYKPWTPVSINLSGYQGKTIRIEFTTTDCTPGAHFGYAYVDINAGCTSTLQSGVFCKGSNGLSFTAPYGYQSYQWSTNNFTQNSGNEQVLSINTMPSGISTYAVDVMPYEGLGCRDTFYTTVKPSAINATPLLSSNATICEGSEVMLMASGAANYFWYKDEQPLGSASGASMKVASAGNYKVELVNSDGCKSWAANEVQLSFTKKPSADFAFDKYCVGLPTKFSPSIADASLGYVWTIDNQTFTQTRPVINFTASGNHQVRLVVTPEGCSQLSVAVQKQITMDQPAAGLKYPVQVTASHKPVTLKARALGEEYQWFPSYQLSDSRSAQPVFDGTQDQQYTIRMARASGCVTVDTQLVHIAKGKEIYVPQAFTPNGDGLNDKVFPTLEGVRELKSFQVFNRWGAIVYQSKTELPGWDGYFQGLLQPTGTYVWQAHGVDIDGNVIKRSGSITLIR